MDRNFRFFTLRNMLFLLALILRIAVVGAQFDHLDEDRDAYLGIAQALANGDGFANPHTGRPTAYRPPLYPLLLAGVLRSGVGLWGLTALHVLAGTATVILTWVVGRRLGLSLGAASLAAALVAVDPLLLQYTSFPMTETVFTFLVITLVAVSLPTGRTSQSSTDTHRAKASKPLDPLEPPNRTVRKAESAIHGDRMAPPPPSLDNLPEPDGTHASSSESVAAGTTSAGRIRAAATGVLFGLAALCRPTILAWAPLLAVWWLWTLARGDRIPLTQVWRSIPWLTVVAAVFTLAPWLVRNVLVFQKPILTTTHGGYTLLLGNNPVFYRDVVAQPWGTVWGGGSLKAWQHSLEVAMQQERPPVEGETARDRWMYDRAWKNIAEQPEMFFRACVLRFLRFWNIAPLAPASGGLPATARTLIGAFYAFVLVGFLLGLLRLSRDEWRQWTPLVLLILAFTVVHLFYWTNMRMRAPVIPIIALISARGWWGFHRPTSPFAPPKGAPPQNSHVQPPIDSTSRQMAEFSKATECLARSFRRSERRLIKVHSFPEYSGSQGEHR